ncbi:arsenic-transporting ATPase [candidate division KSB1 bacterium]|nr:MAG: arsenic-transporting ATPase [candidate division KSB1 bacterium]
MTSVVEKVIGKKFTFFSGKGGVGKSTCAAATALFISENDRKTLLVSTDPAHSLSDVFNKKIGRSIFSITEHLDALEIDPSFEAKKYVRRVKSDISGIISPVLISEIKKQIEIAYLTPGAEEAAIFDKFIEITQNKKLNYDNIVFDTAPTGHTLRLLSLPKILGVWIDSLIEKRRKIVQLKKSVDRIYGRKGKNNEDPLLSLLLKRRSRFELARKILLDKNRTCFIFVVTPEKLSIAETKMSVELLKKYKIEITGLIINRITPEVKNGSPFLEKRRKIELQNIEHLNALLKVNILAKIPLLDMDIQGIEQLRKLREYI